MFARLIITLLLLSASALASPTIDVQTGYGGRIRPGRWNPVFITLSNDQPINALADLSVGDDVVIHRMIGVGPQPQTYVLYAPPLEFGSTFKVDVTNLATGKSLIAWPNDQTRPPAPDADAAVDFYILTAGRSPAMQDFSRSTENNFVTTVQTVRPEYLPTRPIGYDAIDLLYLNEPDWSALTTKQQTALLAWVDGGGVLMLWPGGDAMPANAPLATALPAELGTTETQTLPPLVLKAYGLPTRFGTISRRALMPKANTAMLPVLGDLFAPVGRRGLGRIVVLPIDAAGLQFKSATASQTFWNGLIDPLFGKAGTDNTPAAYTPYNLQSATAAQQALDQIGDLPDVGTFSFSYVLLVVGGLMLLVGPVDFFVLRKLRRQPFTWATTAMWIVVVSTGALYAGRFVQSGSLYFRTLQVIDQADDRVIGRDEVALIYTPRSANYALQPAGPSWWQPVPEFRRFGGTPLSTTLQFIQDDRSNLPAPMWIDVWNWQFLLGRSYEASPPMIQTSLRMSAHHVTGSIQNLTGSHLSNVEIEAGDARLKLNAGIGSHASINVDADFDESSPTNNNAFDLDTTRSNATHRPTLAGFTKRATVFASIDDIAADVSLDHSNARTQHTALLRATVELQP